MLNFVLGLAVNNNFSDYKGPSLVSLFLYLVLFALVLGMAYITTRLVSKNYGKYYGKNIEIVEKMPLGVDRNLMIVRVGKEYYLLSNDKAGVRKIDSLVDFEPTENTVGNYEHGKSFKEILSKYRK